MSARPQPLQRCPIEQRCKTLSHQLMVAIEPTAFLLAQLFRQQAASVDRAQRQGLEFKEVAKLAAPRFTVENQVLDSYPPLPWTVGARFD